MSSRMSRRLSDMLSVGVILLVFVGIPAAVVGYEAWRGELFPFAWREYASLGFLALALPFAVAYELAGTAARDRFHAAEQRFERRCGGTIVACFFAGSVAAALACLVMSLLV